MRHELRHLTATREEQLADDVVIERDEWGVPHVHGRSDAAAAFGLAWAMAEDNYWQIEEDVLAALGWGAHYYGERRLAHDVVRVAFDVVGRARAAYAAEPPERRAVWDGFAHGLNHYLQLHPEAPRRLIARYEPWMLLSLAEPFDADTRVDTLALGGIAALAGVPPAEPVRVAPDAVERSWGWALGPAATGGETLLASAVEAPWFGAGQLYEAEVRSDAGWHVAGAALLGTPVFRGGHGVSTAWLHLPTAAPLQLRVLQFDHPTDSLQYRAEGGWERARWREDTLRVNTSTGVTTRVVRTLVTSHGPVLARTGERAFAAGRAEDAARRLAQWDAVARATSVGQIQAALAEPSPGWTTLFADADGNIGRSANGGVETNPANGTLAAGAAPPLPERAAAGWSAAEVEQALLEARAAGAGARVAALVDEWEMVGGTNPRRAFALDSAVALLRTWDGRFLAESRAALLYALWQEALGRGGDGAYPHFRALEAALAALPPDGAAATWGEYHRLQRRHTSGVQVFADTLPSEPLAAAPTWTGAPLRAYGRRDLGWRRYGVWGRAWTAVTRLGRPPEAHTVVPFGQSADATSRHFQDQAPRFAAGELKVLGFGERLRGHVAERYRPGQRARVLQQ